MGKKKQPNPMYKELLIGIFVGMAIAFAVVAIAQFWV